MVKATTGLVAIIVVVALIIVGVIYFTPKDGNGEEKLTEVIKTIAIDDAGVLTCKGTINNCIILICEIDVTFPYNENMGVLFAEGIWPGGIIPDGQVLLRAPDGDTDWIGAQGEHHIWTLVTTICEESTVFEHMIDDVVTYERTIEDGWIFIADGVYEIQTYFASVSDEPPYEDYIESITETFNLVRAGDEFWFE